MPLKHFPAFGGHGPRSVRAIGLVDGRKGIQDLPDPDCPVCGERMTFYGQLDSINDEFCIADVGLIYVYLCFNDFSAEAVVDSY